MGQIFAICSGKGGAGKSTVCTYLASSLANSGRRVLIIDCDSGLRCLDLQFNVSEQIVFDLSDVLNGRPIEDAVIKIPDYPHLHLIAAPGEKQDYTDKPFFNLFQNILEYYDYIFLDLPAGIHKELYSSLPKITRFIIVTQCSPVFLRDARQMSDIIDDLEFKSNLIINKFEQKLITKGIVPNIDYVIDSVCSQLLGIIPFDENIKLSQLSNKVTKTVNPAFCRISRRLDGEIIPLPNPKKIK